MKMLPIKPLFVLLLAGPLLAQTQTVYIQNGTSGIGTNTTNSNVGIGTATPQDKLDIYGGNINVEGDSTGSFSSQNGLKLLFQQNTNTGRVLSLQNGVAWRNLQIDGNTVVFNTASGGTVGIGTTNPIYKFDVRTPGSTSSQVHIASTDTDAGGYLVSASDDNMYLSAGAAWNGSTGTWVAKSANSGLIGAQAGTLRFYNASGATVGSAAAMTERMRIDTNGNVGIGTTTPGSYKLAVEGAIRARSVVVDNVTWPDFVFADSYRLAPLSEVEAHIKTEKHLPGIPSATEVAQGGVSLGDMQARLLAKVEELTLHVIRQEKEIQSLKEQLKTAHR